MATDESNTGNHRSAGPPLWLIGFAFGGAALLAAVGAFYYFGHNQIDRAFGVTAALLAAVAAIGSVYAFLETERAKDSGDVVPIAIVLNIVIFLSCGLIAVLAASDRWLTALLWALTSLLAGGILGLLLSLPSTEEEVNGAAPKSQARKRQITALGRAAGRVNGVIGGGIAFNWSAVYGELKSVSHKVGTCIVVSPEQQGVAGAGLLLFFGLTGLISGILLTRIFLNRFLDVQAAGNDDDHPDAPAEPETPQ